ncbi:HNH endonuclease signature motif containing protein [Corynebacterium auriscanis]|uniref:HNH endonuclease signature motif containing protein n=2 Tax=Corynebacterium auriscanis TaxID=99807 RepID=UPI0024AD05D4|nr:HNH endonuclease signature motif containing protein [Corynebacterium auriscanis]
MHNESTTPNKLPSWRVTDPHDPLSVAICDVNRGHINLALACAPAMDECVSDITTRLCVRLGLTEYRALTLVDLGHMLRRFPSLIELGKSGAYSLDLWRCVTECLSAVSEEAPDIMEEKIFQALSPTVPNQAMLARATIRNRLEKIVHDYDPLATPIDLDDNDSLTDDDDLLPRHDDDDTGPITRLVIDDYLDNVTEFRLTLPKLEGLELIQALNSVRKDSVCSRAEALMMLVRAETKAEVTLNLYRSVDEPNSQIWAAGGWVSTLATPEWMKRVTHVQAPGVASNNGYAPTPLVRASVEGRDGTCRFPGCSVPAHKCQLDHVQRYNHDNPTEGGPTSTQNLHALCSKHHNVKTAGAWDVTIHPDGNETWTSLGDGHTVMTAPNGPLGRQTFQHRAVRRTLAVHEYNRRKMQQNPNDQPPF